MEQVVTVSDLDDDSSMIGSLESSSRSTQFVFSDGTHRRGGVKFTEKPEQVDFYVAQNQYLKPKGRHFLAEHGLSYILEHGEL